MTGYSFALTMTNIRNIAQMILDIFIIWLIIYYALRIVRSNTRTIQIFKGIILIILVDGLAKLLGLKTLEYFADVFLNWGFLAIIIIFQPEIRSLLEKMGKSNVFSRITTLSVNEKETLVDQIVTAVMLLSKDQTGALISLEQSQSLDDFISTGTKMDSQVSAELLVSLFVTSTPLHDGAVIIQGDRIACASAYFPPTSRELPSRYGARHRAAIGISEVSDCVTIVVSEETGTVSIAEGGKIFPVDRKQLRSYLMRVICGKATEVYSNHHNDRRPSDPSAKKKSSILNKLSVRKQDEAKDEKIHAEEVKPAEINPADQTESTIDEIHEQTDREAQAARIKLPHKKNRPQPGYPEQEKRVMPPEIPSEIEKTAEKNSSDTSSKHVMTPEEVKAAREAALNSYRHIDSRKDNADAKKHDINKITGFNEDLDDTFRMVDDTLPENSSSKHKGGDQK